MMEKYEVVIIGAGPAGASAAKILEEKGHKYLIVDKEVFPRNKPCAGVLSPKIDTVLKIPKELHERPLEGYRIFSPSNTMVESIFPQQGSIVERNVFDAFLIKLLRNQPDHITVKSMSDKGNCVEIISDDWRCETSCVIGADGVNSVVKNYYNIPSKSIAKSAQYVVALPKEAIDNRVGNWFEVYYTLQYGYGWISPMKDCLKIGVGIVSDYIKGSIWQILDKFMTHTTVNEKVKDGKIIRKEAHIIPMSGPLDRLTGNRGILAGDAGGFVYPGTGEGIYYAIKTGRIAAQVIDHAISKQKFNENFLEKTYLHELEKNGLLGLRDVDFVERYLTNTANAEKYVKRLKYMTKIHPSP
jgi:geranylgeranyl reductase family protein